jgi:hypothetical protein
MTTDHVTADVSGPSVANFVEGLLIWSYFASVLPAPDEDSDVAFEDGFISASDGNPVLLWIGTGNLNVGYDGSISVQVLTNTAALTDFAIWQPTSADPAQVLIDTSNSGTVTGGVGAAWTRHYITVFPQTRNPAWSRAAYAAVGLIYKAVPAATVQYIDDVQWEMAPLDTNMPSGYKPARTIQVRVRPTRLNMSTNPSFEVDLTGWSLLSQNAGGATVATVTTTTNSKFGAKCLHVVADTDNAILQHTVVGLLPGHEYIASLYVRNGGCTDVTLSLTGARGDLIKPALTFTQTSPTTGDVLDWRRLYVVFVADTTVADLRLFSTGVTGRGFFVDGVLVEEGNGLADYFDGDSGVPDYAWELTGVAGKARSYYYRDKINRHYSLGKTLRENVAQSIFVDDPIYATSAISAPNTYGSGLYGSGPYGG